VMVAMPFSLPLGLNRSRKEEGTDCEPPGATRNLT
jgi:hypothetical protein